MSLADQLVIEWWLATIIVSIVLLLLFRLNNNRRDTQDVILAMTRGVSPQELRYRTSYGGSVTSNLLTLFLIVALFLLISFLIILWYFSESRFTYLTFQVFLALVGGGFACLAFGRRLDLIPSLRIPRPAPNSIGDKILRVVIFIVGALMLTIFAGMAIKDVCLPWQVIEGKVESLRVGRGIRGTFTGYWIGIGWEQYEATNDVYSTLNIGDYVRVEIAPGSNMIFRAQKIPVTPR